MWIFYFFAFCVLFSFVKIGTFELNKFVDLPSVEGLEGLTNAH